MKYEFLIVFLLGLSLGTASAGYSAADISGTWAFTVGAGESKPFNVTFAFKQEGEKLSGTYYDLKGGEHPVTGTVKGDKVAFSYELASDKSSMKVNYTGTIESPTKMTGAVEWVRGGVPPGKWTATKRK